MSQDNITEGRINKAGSALFRIVVPPLLFGAIRTIFTDVEVRDPRAIDWGLSLLSTTLVGLSGFLITQPRSPILRVVGQGGMILSAAIAPNIPTTQNWAIAHAATHYVGLGLGVFFSRS